MSSDYEKLKKSSMTDVYNELGKTMPLCRDEIVSILSEFLDTAPAYLKIKQLVLMKLGG